MSNKETYRQHIPEEFKEVEYRRFAVGIRFDRELYANIPNKKDLLESWYNTKTKAEEKDNIDQNGQAIDQPQNDKAGTAEEIASEINLSEAEAHPIDVFRRSKDIGFEEHIYLKNHQVKAMLKQSASLLKITVNKRGSKQTISEGMALFGKVTIDGKEYLTNEKVYVQPFQTEPTGTDEFAGTVSSPQGSRNILKVAEYVKDCHLQFEIHILNIRMSDHHASRDVTPQDLYNVCYHGQRVGLGGNRSFDNGQFKLVQFEEITDNPPTPIWGEPIPSDDPYTRAFSQ